MKEIVELNQLLLDHAKDCLPEDGLMLNRHGGDEDLDKIPTDLRKEIDLLREQLNRIMPDDFSYFVSLGNGEALFSVQYENGPTTMYSPAQHWEPAQSLFPQLEAFDWDGLRGECVSQSEAFDHIAEIAKELPVMIPSTKRLQKDFRDEVKAYIKEKRDEPDAHVLIFDGEALFDCDFESAEQFQDQLRDIMPHMVHVVAVVANGKPIPAEKIDAMKKTALLTLEDMPISHAKASGKFTFIMSQMAAQAEEE
jgi:hypothetical protein